MPCLTTQRRSHSRQPLPHSSLLTLTTHAARGHTRGATVRTRACAREPRTPYSTTRHGVRVSTSSSSSLLCSFCLGDLSDDDLRGHPQVTHAHGIRQCEHRRAPSQTAGQPEKMQPVARERLGGGAVARCRGAARRRGSTVRVAAQRPVRAAARRTSARAAPRASSSGDGTQGGEAESVEGVTSERRDEPVCGAAPKQRGAAHTHVHARGASCTHGTPRGVRRSVNAWWVVHYMQRGSGADGMRHGKHTPRHGDSLT